MRKFNKKIFILTLLSIFNTVHAEDYSKMNKYAIQKYEYKNEFGAESLKTKQPNYFTNQIANPLDLRKSKKYQHLANTSSLVNGCWDKAGIAYKVDPWLLFSIAKVESSFNHKATNLNKNKSIDIGLMQINSIWLPTLSKFGITTQDLFDPCTSIFVGAWITAQNIKRFGYNIDGIGAYNAPGNIVLRRNYARKVYAAYAELTRDFTIVSR